MKLGALVLVGLLALPASGSEVVSVERAQLFPDGGTAAVEVEGGCWMSESRCIRTASEIARLRAENESLRQQALSGHPKPANEGPLKTGQWGGPRR
ncbi:hypothetical protein [Myxococcus xanthus]|uniref:hypothetical protein n=1 Tax=Myxococcus xanthus TaxID=34 RepID=UPI001F1D98B3|nr:hypothetical protein [Myxococcus xanthus]